MHQFADRPSRSNLVVPDRTIPFIANSEDNAHCFEAVVGMIRAHFQPQVDRSWGSLRDITGKTALNASWPLCAALRLREAGYIIRYQEDFDFKRFASEGVVYLRERFGHEIASFEEQNSNIPAEMARAQTLSDAGIASHRAVTIDDIRGALQDGFLVSVLVNSSALADRDGYCGHYLLIYNMNDRGVVCHDPGLPGEAQRFITHEKFDRAWAFPSQRERNMLALKYPQV